MFEENIYYFSKSEYSENLNFEKIGVRASRAIELSTLTMPIVPGIILNSDIANKLNKFSSKDYLSKYFEQFNEEMGKIFNSTDNPSVYKIVVSPSLEMVDFPGIHNIGLTDKTIEGFKKFVGENFAYQEYATILLKGTINLLLRITKKEIEIKNLNTLLESIKKAKTTDDFKNIIENAKAILPKNFFEDAFYQIDYLLGKFSDFLNLDNPEENDSALIIQPMVFGNYGEESYSGKFTTRNVITGSNKIDGIYTKNEFDVTGDINKLNIQNIDKKYLTLLEKIGNDIESHFKEIREIKFTVEKGKLWIIEQAKVIKKSAQAELKCLLSLHERKFIDDKYLINQVSTNHINELLHPIIDPNSIKSFKSITLGISGSPGAGIGKIYFNTERLLEANRQGIAQEQDANVILCLPATYAEDVKAIEVSSGVVSNEGGYSAHASVVARQYGKPSIVIPDVEIDTEKKVLKYKDIIIKEGDYVSLDVPYYKTPSLILGKADLIKPELKESGMIELLEILNRNIKEFHVYGNGDTPKDANNIKTLGGEGIGLCRTEHMFFKEERINIFREMIISNSDKERKAALEKLKKFQTKDFYEILKIMNPYPVTIRLLDAPLHEFLPHTKEEMEIFYDYIKKSNINIDKKELAYKCDMISEVNPMLGHRGCRVAVTYPEIYEMQVSAIFDAGYQLQSEGINPSLDIMIPIVMNPEELKFIKHGKKIEGTNIKGIIDVEKEVREQLKVKKPLDYKIGVMIELPAAVLLADELAKYAEFFSFGTNDLTQTTHGLSRDDFNVFLPDYSQFDLIPANPFQVLTEPVKELIDIAVSRGRLTRPDIKIGLCGEQGADPNNVDFLRNIGLNYISCSSYSIPIVKLKLAQLLTAQ